MRWLPMAVLLLAVAGCTHPAAAPAAATAGGSVSGVVVDEAIRPVAGANVTMAGAASMSATTTANGTFAFTGLPAGSYVLHASKPGFLDALATVELRAGQPAVPIHLQLDAERSAGRFFQSVHVAAFLSCEAPGGDYCGAIDSAVGNHATGSQSIVFIGPELTAVGRAPDWLQVELAWSSTQAAFDWLCLRATALPASDGGVHAGDVGNVLPLTCSKSPLMVATNHTVLAAMHVGLENGTEIELFAGANDAVCTSGAPPVMDVPPCALFGAAAQQRADLFLHAFYGYTPPDGWRFSRDGDALPP